MLRTPEEYLGLYAKRNALWMHNGNPLAPHAEIDSGQHTNGYFNSRRILTNPIWSDEAAADMVGYLRTYGLDLSLVNRVVGPQFGAITFAHDVARHISHEVGKACLSGFTEKMSSEKGSPMKLGSIEIEAGEHVLLIEDVLTTGGSVNRSAEPIIASGGIILPFVATVVNRSGQTHAHDRTIVSLVERHIENWPAEECPLCQGGSEVIRKPKDPANWAKLTANS